MLGNNACQMQTLSGPTCGPTGLKEAVTSLAGGRVAATGTGRATGVPWATGVGVGVADICDENRS